MCKKLTYRWPLGHIITIVQLILYNLSPQFHSSFSLLLLYLRKTVLLLPSFQIYMASQYPSDFSCLGIWSCQLWGELETCFPSSLLVQGGSLRRQKPTCSLSWCWYRFHLCWVPQHKSWLRSRLLHLRGTLSWRLKGTTRHRKRESWACKLWHYDTI